MDLKRSIRVVQHPELSTARFLNFQRKSFDTLALPNLFGVFVPKRSNHSAVELCLR